MEKYTMFMDWMPAKTFLLQFSTFCPVSLIFHSLQVIPNGINSFDFSHLVVLVVNIAPAKAGDSRDAGSIPGLGRSPREGNGNPLQYLCLENPTDRGACQAIVHGVAKGQI